MTTLPDRELLADAAALVIGFQFGSALMLHRKLRIPFAQAGGLISALEHEGIVGPDNGADPREVLVDADDKDAAVAALREAM